MNWYLQALKKYAVFDGRACRSEYWWFTLLNIVFATVLLFVSLLFGAGSMEINHASTPYPAVFVWANAPVLGIFYLAILLPSIAVLIRRLHDISRSGWWILLIILPVIGGFVLLIFTLLPSTPGTNEYGPEPSHTASPSSA